MEASRAHPWKPKDYAIGTAVQVLWPDDGVWYDAKILEGKLGIHRIHYDGYGDEWDEWVGPDRIRSPQ